MKRKFISMMMVGILALSFGGTAYAQSGNQKQNSNLESLLLNYAKQTQATQNKNGNQKQNNSQAQGKYTQKELDYLKSIETVLKKSDPKLVVIPATNIVTDNPSFKVDMPLAFKNGSVYMPKSVLEKQYGVAVSYEEQTKKFILKVEGTLVEMFLLQNVIELDGVPKKVDAKPIVIEEKIYLPINHLNKLIHVKTTYLKDRNLLVIDDLDIAGDVVVPGDTGTTSGASIIVGN